MATNHPKFLRFLNGNIYLKALEREFYCIEECVPRKVAGKLVGIVDARKTAKFVHVANGTDNEGHENCL